MATNNLTPELLARILAARGPEYYDAAAGRSYMGNNGSGWTPDGGGGYSGADGFQASAPTEIRGYNWSPDMYGDNFELNGTQYDRIDPNTGEVIGQGTWEGLKKNSAMDTLLPLAMVAAPFALSMFPGLGAAASFGTNPVLSGASASGFAPGAAGAAGGGGYGALGATEPAASIGATGGMTQAELAAMGAGGSGVGTMAPLATLEGPMSSSLLADSLTTMGTGTGLASALGGAAKFLGPAATLLGAAAGAKGQDASQTSVKSMDPRMDKLFYEDLAPRVQGLLAKQMAPGAMQGFTDMQTVGRNLLNTPVAGNGFNRFFPGR